MEKRKTVKGRIRKITKIKNEDTYDIQCPRNQNFFASTSGNRSLLVHNSEIILRPKQFCNLTEVVVRPDDSIDDLKEKIRIASILGTFQSTLTKFKHLSKYWKENCEDERLLGVSLTGIMDHPLLNGSAGHDILKSTLEELRDYAVEINKEFAKKLKISQSTAVTTVKPSGNVSQLVDSASGIHARYSNRYIRTVRGSKTDPLSKLMVASGFPHEDCVISPESTWIFSFPVEAPHDAVMRNDRTAIEQLELWKIYQDHWCEHKPSITVYVKEHEWFEVGSWVWTHFDDISGVSFLPYADHSYQQAPYQECNELEFLDLLSKMPQDFSWDRLKDFEDDDNTIGAETLACTAPGGCEL